MKTLNSLIKEFRKKIKQAHIHQSRITHLEQKREAMNLQQHKRNSEIAQMKELIDWCVLTGEQPTEALLKHTREQMRKQLGSGTVYNMSSIAGAASVYNTMVGHSGVSATTLTPHSTLTLSASPITISCGGVGGGSTTYTSSVTHSGKTSV
jgi:hypothetical protein